jgi:hypothetical protein
MAELLHFLALFSPAKPSRLREFLFDVVNFDGTDRSLLKHCSRKFPEFVPAHEQLESAAKLIRGTLFDSVKPEQWVIDAFAYGLRANLRLAWREPEGYPRFSRLMREDCLFWLTYDSFARKMEPRFSDALLESAVAPLYKLFEAANAAIELQDKMGYCGNPECPAPYFFETRRGQRFCSEECAGVGMREAKKRWWDKHGKEWRRKQGRQRKSQRKRGK